MKMNTQCILMLYYNGTTGYIVADIGVGTLTSTIYYAEQVIAKFGMDLENDGQ